METQETRGAGPDALAAAERVVEAIIFASRIPVPEEYLQSLIEVPVPLVLDRLGEFYAPPRAPRLVRVVGGWKFSCEEAVKELPPREGAEKQLGRTAMGVMACVLWHQPVTLASITEFIGQRPNSATMKMLKQLGWIAHGERSQEPGRPMTWVTTQEFLDHLGVAKLSDLPDPDLLHSITSVPEEREEPFSPAAMPVAGRR